MSCCGNSSKSLHPVLKYCNIMFYYGKKNSITFFFVPERGNSKSHLRSTALYIFNHVAARLGLRALLTYLFTLLTSRDDLSLRDTRCV